MNVAADARNQNKDDDAANDDVCTTCTESHGARVSVLNLHANTAQF